MTSHHDRQSSESFHTDMQRRRALQLLAGSVLTMAGTAHSAAGVEAKPSPLTRAIPRSGEQLPVVGLGTWQTFDVGPGAAERAELKEVLKLLVEQGARVVDSSPMYGQAERVVGDLATDLGIHQKLFIATKVWTQGRDAGIRQMENSFKLLRAPRIDLMQVHNLVDVPTHIKTLREWKTAGRIRYLGITHYHDGAYRDLERLVKTREYDFVQFNYSMTEREAEERLLPLCADSGTAVLINRPFAQASLFSRVKGKPLPPWAAEFDCTSWAQFFLKYLLGHPAVTCVIPGTRRTAHLKDNLRAGIGRLPDAAMRKRMVEHVERL
jgi:aryl-alcohol dehydrogenase-like predicted oxidoreductase